MSTSFVQNACSYKFVKTNPFIFHRIGYRRSFNDSANSGDSWYDSYHRVLSRTKRAIDPAIVNFISSSAIASYCAEVAATSYAAFAARINTVILAFCTGLGNYPYDFPVAAEVACCNYVSSCIDSISEVNRGSTVSDCLTYLTGIINTAIPAYCNTPTTASTCNPTTASTTTTTFGPPYAALALQMAPVVYGAGALAAAGIFMATPTVAPLVTNQAVPNGFPQPGTPFGGGLPIGNSATSIAALSLVPAGLIPVAIFPPFVR